MKQLNKTLNNEGALLKAARRRVTDFANVDLDNKTRDELASNWLRRGGPQLNPELRSGGILMAEKYREFIKDCKFIVSMNNEQLSSLHQQVNELGLENMVFLNELESEIYKLNSFLDEEQIRIFGKWNTVYFNAFVKNEDYGLALDDETYLFDFKTRLPVLKDFVCHTEFKQGVTLPLIDRYQVPITDVQLVGEDTNVGDSPKVLVSTDVRNLLLPNKIFQHVVVRTDSDVTEREYNYKPTTLGLLITYNSLQFLNHLELETISQDIMSVDSLFYINANGEEVELELDAIQADTKITISFSPVYTRFLKLVLSNKAAIAHTVVIDQNKVVTEANKLLAGVGWSTFFNETTLDIQGRIYDFSISSLKTALNVYQPYGIWRSQPVKVKDPGTISLSTSVQQPVFVVTENNYNIVLDTLALDPIVEFYMGIKLYDQDLNLVIDQLVPITDGQLVQSEILPLGTTSRLKFLPDLFYTGVYNRIQSATITGNPTPSSTVVFEDEHGLGVGDQVCIVGSQHLLTGLRTVLSVTDLYTVVLEIEANDTDYDLVSSTSPYLYSFVQGTAYFNVYKNDTLLTLGTDYLVSFDGGVTWNSSFDYLELYQLATSSMAGDCLIRPTRLQYDAIYHVEYRALDGQFLESSKLVILKDGDLNLPRFRTKVSGDLYTVAIMRMNGFSSYTSPEISSYTLKVREYVVK